MKMVTRLKFPVYRKQVLRNDIRYIKVLRNYNMQTSCGYTFSVITYLEVLRNNDHNFELLVV